MNEIEILLEGYRRFYAKHFIGCNKLYKTLALEGQSPKVMLICCSDSRVDPAILTNSGPGDIFVVHNVANLVPRYQPDERSYHGTSAALEFAVNLLDVKHIIVMGHSGCASIKALVDNIIADEYSFVNHWVSIAADARERTIRKCNHSKDNWYYVYEKEGIISSISNLMTFPWIKYRENSGKINLHGWYFSIENGCLQTLSEGNNYVDAILN